MSSLNGYPEIPIERHTVNQIVFDLDGVLAESVWPQRRVIGPVIPEGIAMLKYYASQGFSICISTARPRVEEDNIWAWVYEHGLPVDKVRCDKPVAALYVDDRAWRFERG